MQRTTSVIKCGDEKFAINVNVELAAFHFHLWVPEGIVAILIYGCMTHIYNTYMYLYIYIYIHTYIYVYIYIHMCTYVHVCVCSLSIHSYYVFICLFIYLFILFIYMFICLLIYVINMINFNNRFIDVICSLNYICVCMFVRLLIH